MPSSMIEDNRSTLCKITAGEFVGQTAWLFVYSMIFVMAVTGQTIGHMTSALVK